MTILFEVKDPFGVITLCTKEHWKAHVLDNHKEMTNHVDWVLETLKNPEAIYVSAKDKSCNVYYWRPEGSNLYVRSIVKVHKGNKGEFKTAHLVSGPKPREVLKWQR